MKIVIDTGVVVSALFFGGQSRRIVEAVAQGRLTAYATREIVEEYEAVVAEMKSKAQGGLRSGLLLAFAKCLHIVGPKPLAGACRDPGDEKFISCALAADAVYIVGGDKEVSFSGACKPVIIMAAEGVCEILALYA